MPRSTRNSTGLVPAPEARPDGYFIHDNDTVVDIVDVTTRTRSITFTVFGPPRYKERSKNNYEARRVYMTRRANENQKRFRALLVSLMGKRRGFGGPDVALKLKAAFYLERPKSHFKQNKIGNPLSSRAIPVSRARGDIDNFLKFIMDCMNGIMYKDDRQITNLGPSKKAYAAGPEAFQGRTIITISDDVEE